MKNLTNCTPGEFIKQSVRVKKIASKWLKDIDLVNIRSRQPEYITIPITATAEERKEILLKNAQLQKEQAIKNLSELFDMAFEKYPDETLSVLALLCFVEPENVNDHSIVEYLDSVMDVFETPAILRFFGLLASMQSRTPTNKA